MPSAAERSTPSILVVLFFGVLMGALDIAIVGPALPALPAACAVDERAVAWVLTIFVLFNLIGTPVMSKLSDRLGRRLVYTLDVALFALGSLLVGRAVQAFGAAGIFPVASAVIGDAPPPEKRRLALGLLGEITAAERGAAQGILTIFTSIGMLLSGVLIGANAASAGGGAAGYRESFSIIAAITLAVAVFALGIQNKRATAS